MRGRGERGEGTPPQFPFPSAREAGPGGIERSVFGGLQKAHGREEHQHLESCFSAHCRGEGRKGPPPPPQAGLPGPRRGGEGPPGPGRGRGGRSDAAGGGEERLGRRRADEEKGRGHGPALRLPRVRPLLEPETGAGDAQGSDPQPVRPRPCPVRGARPQPEVSRDGPRARRGTGTRGAEGSGDHGASCLRAGCQGVG